MATTRPPPSSLSQHALRRQNPRQEPSAVVPHAGICAGGRPQGRSLPRPPRRQCWPEAPPVSTSKQALVVLWQLARMPVAGRMATRRIRTHRLLALHPARRHSFAGSGAAGEDPLAHRTRLPRTQRRPRSRPFRRPQFPGLAPSCHPRRAGSGVLHPAALRPKSPCAGLTLYAVLRELQSLFAVWTGACHTYHQPVPWSQQPPGPMTQQSTTSGHPLCEKVDRAGRRWRLIDGRSVRDHSGRMCRVQEHDVFVGTLARSAQRRLDSCMTPRVQRRPTCLDHFGRRSPGYRRTTPTCWASWSGLMSSHL